MVRTYDDSGYRFDPVELYDMASDPYQTTNIRDENADRVRVMDHYLTEWLHEQRVKPYAIPDPMQVELRERKKRKQLRKV